MLENKEGLKDVEETTEDIDPSVEKQGDETVVEPVVEETMEDLKERLAKAESDRDNYKTGMLSAKAKKTILEPVEEEVVIEEEEDEELEAKIDARTKVILEKKEKESTRSNEVIAVEKWLVAHPELYDDKLKKKVIDWYVNKNGKTVDGVLLDLEKAYKFYRMDNNTYTQDTTNNTVSKDIASMPSGDNTAPTGVSGFNQSELNIIKQYDIKPELFKQWKEKVLNGQMKVPDEVYNLLTKG